MVFPYGEWVILFLTLLTWSEKRASQRFFLILTIAWLIGKGMEIVFVTALPWNWHFARLSVMLAFWVWALKRSEHKLVPFLFTSIVFCAETLFYVNEPGVFPYVSWAFAFGKFLVAWLSARTYWGTAAALTGSAIFNQLFVRVTYDGIIRYIDLPNNFTWNFGVLLFAVWAGFSLGGSLYWQRTPREPEVKMVPSNSLVNYESPEERDLQ